MLAEFIQAIVGLGIQAQELEIRPIKGLNREVLVRCGDGYKHQPLDPPLREHTVNGLADFVRAVKDGKLCGDAMVFHDEGELYAFLDRGDRREHVKMPLVQSQRFRQIVDLADGDSFSIKQAVKFLRFHLHGSGAEEVIKALSRVNFERKSDGNVTVSHGRESLGRSVEATVQAKDEVPEVFKVDVPVYTNPGATWTMPIKIGVYLDVQDESIELRTLSDQTTEALNEIQDEIAGILESELPDVPIFHGSP